MLKYWLFCLGLAIVTFGHGTPKHRSSFDSGYEAGDECSDDEIAISPRECITKEQLREKLEITEYNPSNETAQAILELAHSQDEQVVNALRSLQEDPSWEHMDEVLFSLAYNCSNDQGILNFVRFLACYIGDCISQAQLDSQDSRSLFCEYFYLVQHEVEMITRRLCPIPLSISTLFKELQVELAEIWVKELDREGLSSSYYECFEKKLLNLILTEAGEGSN